MRVGLIGTGKMGKPMAHHILEAGHSLTIYARNPEKVEDLVSEGAVLVSSPAEVGAASDYILLSLPFDSDVEEVLLGKNGLIEGASPGTLIIDTTTGTPKMAVQVAAAIKKMGVDYLDAPISGGVKGAKEGKLAFLVGGEEVSFGKALPLMKLLGPHLFHIGPVGAGRALKALNQMIAALNTLTLCEAVVLGKKLGIGPERFYEALSQCAANSYHLQMKLPQFIIPGKFEGGHHINMMIKDMEIGLEVGKEMKTPMMLGALATQIYRAGASAGYGNQDISALANFLGSFVGVDFTKE